MWRILDHGKLGPKNYDTTRVRGQHFQGQRQDQSQAVIFEAKAKANPTK